MLIGSRRASAPLSKKPGKCIVPGFPVWSAALSRVRQNLGDAIVIGHGDSHTAGTGAGDASDMTNANARYHSYGAQLMRALERMGFPIDTQAIYGNGARSIALYPSYNPAVTIGSGWNANGTQRFGYSSFISPASDSTSLWTAQFKDTSHVTIEVLKQTSTNQFTYSIDGGAMSAVQNATGSGILTLDIPLGAPGDHSISFAVAAGSSVGFVLMNVVPRNIYRSKVRYLNISGGGMTSSDWVINTAPQQCFQSIMRLPQPDLYLLRNQSNDETTANDATYQSNITASVAQAQLRAPVDILLIADIPRSGGDAVNATYGGYNKAIAAAKGVNFLDLSHVLGINASHANADGWMFDTIHENRTGYALEIQKAFGPLLLPQY